MGLHEDTGFRVSPEKGALFGGPSFKDHNILGSVIIGVRHSGKLPTASERSGPQGYRLWLRVTTLQGLGIKVLLLAWA